MKRIDPTYLLALAIIGAVALLGLLWSTARPATLTLRWSAPGDDGMTGQAAQYDLRWQTYAPGADSAAWWDAATVVVGLPAPGLSGATDSMSLALPPGSYVFNIRTADEVPNWSSCFSIGCGF